MSTNKGIVSYGPNDLERRKPKLLLRSPGSHLMRLAERRTPV